VGSIDDPDRLIGSVFIKHLGLLGTLDDEDCKALLSLKGEVRNVGRGHELFRVGDRPTEAVVVIRGLLQRHTLSAEGKRQIHSFYLPGDTPSVESIHVDRMDNILCAVVPSKVGLVPHAELKRVMEQRPNVLALLWRETLVQAAVFREWLLRNSRLLAHAQMAHFFCEILIRAKALGVARGNLCDLPITQEELADALGMTSVHVNRTLMVLRAGNLVEFERGQLHVLDWPKLAATGEFDPGYLHFRPGALPADL
jgi:CRP-like cAMP-binding protein